MENLEYPIRINRYLALKNICSRKEADDLVARGQVKINGKTAVLGSKVNENDKVEVNNFKKDYIYLAFNKPEGVITHSPQGEEVSIKQLLKKSLNVFPLGRLDKDSSGLIILTNDGRLTDKLLNPEYEHEKEYIVTVNKPYDELFLRNMANGVTLDDGYVTKQCSVKELRDKVFSIILTEGKNRQIRRMCGALGYGIVKLKRIRILNIKVAGIEEGGYRYIQGEELERFLKKLGL